MDSLISQNSEKESNNEDKEEKYTRTVGFKVTEKQYETYRRYSKYFGTEELIKKWRADIERIEKEKGKDLESIELDIKKRLTK